MDLLYRNYFFSGFGYELYGVLIGPCYDMVLLIQSKRRGRGVNNMLKYNLFIHTTVFIT